ncbi:MAG: sensor domain-containing diguanylate cyclase [Candidatus Omnitrophica bacterium]|nr:sensor domain-containing diguanylate cyclase [Candidatus Omnitrophota bacterium]
MWRRIIVFIVIGLILWFHLAKGESPFFLFFSIPIFFLLVFYLLIEEDKSFVAVGVSFVLLASVYGVDQTKNEFFFLLTPVLLLILGEAFLYQRSWNRKIAEIESKKRLMRKESEALEERYAERLESLRHLERRVNGLSHLFEMARDFSECLDFSSIISILDRKMAPELSFTRGSVIVLSDSTAQMDGNLNHCLSFGPQKRQDEILAQQFAEECVKLLGSMKEMIKIDGAKMADQTYSATYQTAFPLWLFPLLVGQQLIGVLAIEGGSENDFQKFEVLASQLALQVKKVRLFETVKETSIVDGLTQVFVRRHFLERFREELNRSIRYHFPLSVLMVDVDHFKSYNDKFGHLVGDKTLREAAQIIRENVRRVDVIGRYGGEEFLIIAPEIEKKQALELAERVRSAVAKKHFSSYDEETQVTVSIGVSSFPEDLEVKKIKDFSEEFVTSLIQKADQALYRAKEEGRNRVVAHG